jgi:adenosylcobinamide-phosphate synthase
MERSLFALCALLLNMALASPRQWYGAFGLSELFQIPAAALRNVERKLNREHRSLQERQWRGMLLIILVLIGSLLIGWIFSWLSRHGLEFAELLIVTIALPVRPTWDRVSQIRKGLYAGDIATARQALVGTAWRHQALLDDYGLARAGIEMLAVNFSDKILAPIFWYMLLGLPGLFISKSIVLMQETLTQPNSERFAPGFGQAAQVAHHWLHFIPARLAIAFWLLAALFVPSCKWKETAQRIMAGIYNETPQGIALLSAASVLNLTLGGPVSMYADEKWIGSGTAKPMPADIKRALNLFALLHLSLFILLGLFI